MIHHQIFTWIPLIVVIPFLVFACEKEDLAYPKQPKFAQLPSEILQQDFALSNAFVGIKATQDAHDLVKDFSKDLAKESGDNLFFLKQFSAYFSSFLVQKELDQNEINGNAENRDAENRDTENRDTENRDTENRDAENRDAEISSDSVLSKDSQISDLGIKSSNLGSSNLGQSLSLDQSLDLKIISENKQIPIIQHYQVKPEDFEVAYDFSDHLNDAYVERNAMIIAPNMPGWTYQIEQTEGNGLNSSWQPPTFAHQHYISWLQGLGATLKFHVSAEMAKQSLNTILIWVESVGTNQKLSIFLDRNHLTNLSLKGKAQFYKIQLNQSLTAGEHQIRFWFKFAKNIDQKNIKNIKSPGAIGPIFINPKDEPIDLPNKWQNQTERLIFAGPPQQYSFPKMRF
jgi:hypothetical protein